MNKRKSHPHDVSFSGGSQYYLRSCWNCEADYTELAAKPIEIGGSWYCSICECLLGGGVHE
jgi:hypothetical protein